MTSLQGKFLLASPSLADPNFARSVVLIVRHDSDGALGIIVNRPLELSVLDAIGEGLDLPVSPEGPLHQGGPCQGPLMVLHTQEYPSESEILPSVHFSVDREKVEWLLKNESGPTKYFVGYAGWSPGQLEVELESGSWVILSADSPLVFGPPDEMWNRLLSAISLSKWVPPHRIPTDPSVN